MALSSVALSIAANASLVGAKTVMSLAVLSVSPSLAAVTAVTRVDRTGLFEAAVATGAVAMPSKLPAPVAGTAPQAEPKVVPSIIAALPDGAAIDGAAIDGAAVAAVVAAVVGAVEGTADAPLLEQAPTKVAARSRPAKAAVRLRLITWFSCVVGRAKEGPTRGWMDRPAQVPGRRLVGPLRSPS